MRDKVMEVVKVSIQEWLEQEWKEYHNWIINCYPGYPKTEESQHTFKTMKGAFDTCTHQLEVLKENRIGEHTLELIQERIWQDEEMLISGSPIEEFAAVGVLRSWLREYEDCNVKSVKFRMDGTWECFEEDITIQ